MLRWGASGRGGVASGAGVPSGMGGSGSGAAAAAQPSDEEMASLLSWAIESNDYHTCLAAAAHQLQGWNQVLGVTLVKCMDTLAGSGVCGDGEEELLLFQIMEGILHVMVRCGAGSSCLSGVVVVCLCVCVSCSCVLLGLPCVLSMHVTHLLCFC